MNDSLKIRGIMVAVAGILAMTGCGCLSANSGRQGTVEMHAEVPITTEVATDLKTELASDVSAQIEARVEAALAHVETSKTINYATDVWPGRVAAVMVPVCLLFAWWQAHRHGYWRQRGKRLRRKPHETPT